jgi:hypothetical protein
VNSLSVSSASKSTDSVSLPSSFQTMEEECSGDKSATTWSHIFVRYLFRKCDKVKRNGESDVAHRMNVTLFLRTEEMAESLQVESSGQYMTY